MRGFKLAIIAILLIPAMANAQYWFQSGARGAQTSYFNHGAKVTIQTITDQDINNGSLAFWVGETLSNGAFIQVGYLVPNQSAEYPSICTVSGCTSKEYLTKGTPAWFYEYFNPGTGSTFLGAVGPDGSAGANNSIHTYGFYSVGDIWYITMDNSTIGQVDLGTNNSGRNDIVAFLELANVSGPYDQINPVIFSNLSEYNDGRYTPLKYGFAYTGYGDGSESSLPNPYGVQELANRANYFEAGSEVPIPSQSQILWELGYYLNIDSPYGNISSSTSYLAYKTISLFAPAPVYLGNGTRASFVDWIGSGTGSYSGSNQTAEVTLLDNVTENANWQIEYLLNVSSPVGGTFGGGWYPAGATTVFGVNSTLLYTNSTSRWAFGGWSNRLTTSNVSVEMAAPIGISALWLREYLVNASSPYGNVIGSGWYATNSTATLSLPVTSINTSNSTRIAFYSWSDGSRNATTSLNITGPASIYANFRGQSLVSLAGLDSSGSTVEPQEFYINGQPVGNSTFLFNGDSYEVTGAMYKGTMLSLNQSVSVGSPQQLAVPLPVYDMQIKTSDIFGIPVNASVRMSFLNGTSETLYSGPQGIIELEDVPYGAASISAVSAGETVSADTKGQDSVRVSFLSVFDMAALAAIAVAGILSYIAIGRRLSKPAPAQSDKTP